MYRRCTVLLALADSILTRDLADSLVSSTSPPLVIDVANNNAEVLEKVSRYFFYLVLLDFSLPGVINGIEVLRRVRSISPNTEVIVIVEEESNPSTSITAINEGAFICLEKPLSVAYLKTVILKTLERQELRLEGKKRLEQLNSLLASTEDIYSQLDIRQLLRRLLKRALDLTRSECGSIALFDNNGVVLREFWDGKDWQNLSDLNIKINMPRPVIRDRFFAPEVEDHISEMFVPLPWVNSYMCVPIIGKGNEFLGVIEICNKRGGDFDQGDDAQLLEGLARTAAIAIENARLYEDIRVKSRQVEISEQRYRNLVENSPDLIFIIQNNRFKYVNMKGCQVLKYTAEELYSFNVVDIVAPVSRSTFMENLKKLLLEGVTFSCEATFVKKSGQEVILDISSAIVDYEGKPAVQIIARDITEKKKADEEILRLAAAVRSLNSAVTITDMNRNIVYINPAHKKIFGYELEELIGKQSSILYPYDDPSGISKKIYDAVLTVGWEGERIGVRKNGEAFPAYERTSVVKDKDGRAIAIVSVVEDISLRKQLEQALRESEEKYRVLIESARSAIIATDQKGNITLFNPAAEGIFGYSEIEIRGRDITVLLPDRYREVYKADIKRFIETGISDLVGKTVELVGVRKDGREFPIEVSISACRIGGEQTFTVIVFDITERKSLQEQLIQSAKLAAVGELISGVTHEVNNPLAVIMGYSEMLMGEPELDSQVRKALEIIYNEAERARKVIRNLLSFARPNRPEKQYVSVNDIVDRTIGLIEYDLKKNNIALVRNLDPALPPTMADPNQLQQVFLNLLINAQQALSEKEGERQITIESRVKGGGDNRVIELFFKDNGSGIPEENLNKVFDPFFSTKPKGKGTGLGLSVSYGIVKEHGGRIYVMSKEGEGATFCVELPLVNEST